MGAMKRYAESVSEEMNFGGEINFEVLAEAQRRLDEAADDKDDDGHNSNTICN